MIFIKNKKAWFLFVVVCTASKAERVNELIRVELISRLRFGLLPALATRFKQNINFALKSIFRYV
jgi:hypothetical protein